MPRSGLRQRHQPPKALRREPSEPSLVAARKWILDFLSSKCPSKYCHHTRLQNVLRGVDLTLLIPALLTTFDTSAWALQSTKLWCFPGCDAEGPWSTGRADSSPGRGWDLVGSGGNRLICRLVAWQETLQRYPLWGSTIKIILHLGLGDVYLALLLGYANAAFPSCGESPQQRHWRTESTGCLPTTKKNNEPPNNLYRW